MDAVRGAFDDLELLQQLWTRCSARDKSVFKRFQHSARTALGKSAAASGDYLEVFTEERHDPTAIKNARRVLRERQAAIVKITGEDLLAQLNYAFLNNNALMDAVSRISDISNAGGATGGVCAPPPHRALHHDCIRHRSARFQVSGLHHPPRPRSFPSERLFQCPARHPPRDSGKCGGCLGQWTLPWGSAPPSMGPVGGFPPRSHFCTLTTLSPLSPAPRQEGKSLVVCGLTVRDAMELCVETGMSHAAYTAMRHIMPNGYLPAIGKVTKLKKSLAPGTMHLEAVLEEGQPMERVEDGTMVADMVDMLSRDIEVYQTVWDEISDPIGQPRAPAVKAKRKTFNRN
jgi:hypothetical protein